MGEEDHHGVEADVQLAVECEEAAPYERCREADEDRYSDQRCECRRERNGIPIGLPVGFVPGEVNEVEALRLSDSALKWQ